MNYEVNANEEVMVQAGTFTAYRVEIVRTLYESHSEKAWFTPELGQVIKGIWSRTSSRTDTGLRPIVPGNL